MLGVEMFRIVRASLLTKQNCGIKRNEEQEDEAGDKGRNKMIEARKEMDCFLIYFVTFYPRNDTVSMYDELEMN